MAVDSRQKGSRAELVVRDELRKLTGLQWERVPSSGALSPVHKLKGDLYIVEQFNLVCVEVKHYADDHLTSKVLTDGKPQLEEWWDQTVRESTQVGKEPLLIFKHDRGKLFCAFRSEYRDLFGVSFRYIYIGHLDIFITQLTDFIKHCKPEFIK